MQENCKFKLLLILRHDTQILSNLGHKPQRTFFVVGRVTFPANKGVLNSGSSRGMTQINLLRCTSSFCLH